MLNEQVLLGTSDARARVYHSSATTFRRNEPVLAEFLPSVPSRV